MTLDIHAIKNLATAVAHTANAVDGVFADGKVDWRDAGRFPELLGALKDFGSVDFMDVLPELADLTAGEHADLTQHFNQVFNLSEDGVEQAVETGFELILDGVEAIQAIREIAVKIRDRFTPASA